MKQKLKQSTQSLSKNCFFKVDDKVGEPLTTVKKEREDLIKIRNEARLL